MNISAINLFNTPNVAFGKKSQKNINLNSKPDTFERSSVKPENYNESYQGFRDWASKNNFFGIVDNIMQGKGKAIGYSFEGVTYEIPNNQNFKLKEERRSWYVPTDYKEPAIIEIDDFSPELNVGQNIAKVLIPGKSGYAHKYYISKRQTGKELGVDEFSLDKIDDYNIKKHKNSLKSLAELPQSSFDKCIQDINTVTEAGYAFEYMIPNNILIDNKKEEIHFTEVKDKLRNETEQYGQVLYEMLGAGFGERYINENRPAAEKEKIKEYNRIIVDKYFNAMKSQGAKFDDDGYINNLLYTNLLNGNIDSLSHREQKNELEYWGLI